MISTTALLWQKPPYLEGSRSSQFSVIKHVKVALAWTPRCFYDYAISILHINTGILPMNMSPGSMPVLQQADVEISTQSTTQQGLHALNQRLRVMMRTHIYQNLHCRNMVKVDSAEKYVDSVNLHDFPTLLVHRAYPANLNLQRRKAQNRASQRAFRARKETAIKDSSACLDLLQQQVTRLQSTNDTLSTTVNNLKADIGRLQKEKRLMKVARPARW